MRIKVCVTSISALRRGSDAGASFRRMLLGYVQSETLRLILHSEFEVAEEKSFILHDAKSWLSRIRKHDRMLEEASNNSTRLPINPVPEIGGGRSLSSAPAAANRITLRWASRKRRTGNRDRPACCVEGSQIQNLRGFC